MITIYLQHKSDGNDCFMTEKVAHIVTDIPINRSRTGYGAKIPTCYKVKYNGRFYRVYSECFSNLSREYIAGEFGKINVRIDSEV